MERDVETGHILNADRHAALLREEVSKDTEQRAQNRRRSNEGGKKMKTKVMAHEQMVAKMLKNPAVRAETDQLNRAEFAILDEILAARRAAGLSQAQVAERMGTKAPAIARLESALASGKHSPSLNTLRKYADALGKRVEVHLV